MMSEEALEEGRRVERLLFDAYNVITYLVSREELDSKEFLMRIHLWRTPVSEALKAVNSLVLENRILVAQNQNLIDRLAKNHDG